MNGGKEKPGTAGIGFLTFAFGKPRFFRMARSLLLSFRRFEPELPFAVVTDDPHSKILSDFDKKIRFRPEFGGGLAQKLHVDIYSPFSRTIFVDSDGLFYKNPESLLKLFPGEHLFEIHAFRNRSPEDGFPGLRDVRSTFERLGIESAPFLNSGLFSFDSSPASREFFEHARQLARQAGSLGLLPKDSHPYNDETVWSLALASRGIPALNWSGGEAMEMYSHVSDDEKLNIAVPCAEFRTYGRRVDPIFVHFCAGAQHAFRYYLEVARLERAVGSKDVLSLISSRVLAGSRMGTDRLTGAVRKRVKGLFSRPRTGGGS